MTLLSEIVQQAYRDSNLIPIGASPTTAESTEALKRLQVIIASVLGAEAGEQLTEYPIGDGSVTRGSIPSEPWTVPLNVRLVCNLESATTLYLDPRPQDGSRVAVVDASGNFATYNLTLNGNGRKVDGGTTDVLSTNSQSIQYFYRADLGEWKVISPSSMVAGDTFPFPEEFDDMFIIMLATRLNPRNAQGISPESMAMVERSREQFRARYKQIISTPADLAVLNTTNRTYGGNITNGWML